MYNDRTAPILLGSGEKGGFIFSQPQSAAGPTMLPFPFGDCNALKYMGSPVINGKNRKDVLPSE